MKKGPAEFREIIQKGKRYTDWGFYRRDTLYWPFMTGIGAVYNYESGIISGDYKFERINDIYPQSTLFGEGVSWNDVVQGSVGNCYFLASIAAIAEHPNVIKKVFLTDQVNSAGIYAFRMYIRGKPWVVTIDDSILVSSKDNEPIFATRGVGNSLWPILLEKAWSKIKGSY